MNSYKVSHQVTIFPYVNNNNISFNDICGDRVHLEESGSVKLANNILNVLNNFNSR